MEDRKCRVCGCTDDDCRQCIEAQGHACSWLLDNLCTRCAKEILCKPPPLRKQCPYNYLAVSDQLNKGYDCGDDCVLVKAKRKPIIRIDLHRKLAMAGLKALKACNYVVAAECFDEIKKGGA